MWMKHCSRCSQEKPLLGFPVNRTKKDGRGGVCLECQRQYNRNHYQNNKRYYIDKAGRRQDELVEEVRAIKERPCADCGKEYPYYVMDFDHREDKKFNISEKLVTGARKQILNEIKKCDVVCSNCHRERTHHRSKNLSVSPLATNQLKE